MKLSESLSEISNLVWNELVIDNNYLCIWNTTQIEILYWIRFENFNLVWKELVFKIIILEMKGYWNWKIAYNEKWFGESSMEAQWNLEFIMKRADN